MKKARNLNQWTFLFYSLLGIALIACEKEDFQINEGQAALLMEEDLLDDQASPSRWTSDDRNYGAIATFGEINGEIGKIIDAQRTVAKKKINSFADYSTDKAAFIYVDLDEFPYQGETSIKDFIYNAKQVNASLIFESGTRNQKKFNELGFFTEEIPCGIVVLENSKNSKQSLLYYLPDTLSDASLINRLRMHPVKDINETSLRASGDPSIKITYPNKKCSRKNKKGKCINWSYGVKHVEATNTIYAIEDNSKWEYRIINHSLDAKAHVRDWGNVTVEILETQKYFCSSKNLDNLGPEYLCDVVCEYGKIDFNTSYSSGIQLGGKLAFSSIFKGPLKKLTFSADGGIGSSSTTGTMEGTNINLSSNNAWKARAHVAQNIYDDNAGYFTGKLTYTIQRRRKSGSKRHWRKEAVVTANLVNYGTENNWKGIQPKSEPYYGWTMDPLPEEYQDTCD